MSQEKQRYLEKELEAEYRIEDDTISIVFQREKIKLNEENEIGMLDDIGSYLEKEVIFSEDELILKFQKPSYFKTFSQIKELDERSRYMFASQLVKAVKNHAFPRLHLFICPDNLFVDESLTPHFLHYGVKGSLPPYEQEPIKRWNELRAAVAAAVDDKYSFEQYLHFNQTVDLTGTTAEIMRAENDQQLLELLKSKIKEIEQQEKQFVKVTQKKWKGLKFSAIAMGAVLVPLLIFSLYTLIISQPKQTAFINSQEHFLKKEYSQIINTLANYKVDDMPRVIQYQLAYSHLVNEALSETQKDNVLNTITLQSDPLYSKYWIYIGRGEPEEALKIGRELEDFDLIMYALIHYEEAVKADHRLKEEDKQRELNKIKAEKEEYERNLQQQLENEAELQEQEEAAAKEAPNQAEAGKTAEDPSKQANEEADKSENGE